MKRTMESPGRLLCAAPGFDPVGGMETFMADLVGALSERGWDTHCISTTYQGEGVERLKQAASCHDLSALPLSPAKVFRAAEIVNAVNPGILLLNHCPLVQYALPLLRETIRTLSVLHSDDPRFYRSAAIFRNRVFRWIAPTGGVAQNAVAWVGRENSGRISVIPHGVNTALFFPEPVRSAPSGRIAFVGYVAENKGADLLPEIMRRVVKAHPAAHLTVVGHGPLAGEVERRFREAGLGDSLSLPGAASHEEVAAILRRSDVFLLPTRVEGFGLAIAEAMLCGAVPVVTRLRGVTDCLVDHGRSGFLVERDDVAGFADAVCALLGASALFNVFSEFSASEARARFSHGRMIEDYERIFVAPDSEPRKKRRSAAGWLAELLPEMIRGEAVSGLLRKGRYLFK